MTLAPLLLGFLLASCSSPRVPQTSIFGEPLFVNGKRVTDDEIKLALIYGPGRMALDLRKTELLIENEIARQADERAEAEIVQQETFAPSKTPDARAQMKKSALVRMSALLHEKYRIRDEEFDAEYTYTIDDFRKGYPTLEINAEICRAYRSVDWYREQSRQQMCFDRVFLPPNPENWPKTSLEAIRADPAGGELLIPDAKQSYKARLEVAAKNDGELPREDPLYMTFLRDIVRSASSSAITFKTQANGIDPKLALWADCDGDGKPELAVRIDELWEKVQDTVTETEIAEAKQWLITAWATRDRLEKDGALLAGPERRTALAEYTSSLGAQGLPLEEVARHVYYFPSTESYLEYVALKKGFERLIATKLADGPDGGLSPSLREYVPRANEVFGLGRVDSEVLLVSAMDVPRWRWKKDGWFKARRKAQRLRAEYDKDPTTECWSRLMDKHSEYWDPPPPEYHEGMPRGGSTDVGRKKKGRFGPRYRNDLMNYVGETSYSEWVTGECITDRIFFDQAEGTVAGPFRGPLGWYLTRVTGRTPPTQPLDLADPKYVQLLKDDYLRYAFIQYSKEAVAQAEIKGWEPL